MTMTLTPTTVIREATEADVPRLVELGHHFHGNSIYGAHYSWNPEYVATTCTYLITHPEGCAFVAERDGIVVGMIGCVIGPNPLTGDRVAIELTWWVEPTARGVGLRLLRRAEQWATAAGATSMQLGAPSQEVAQMYERMGCVLIEQIYHRPLRRGPTHD